uniref:VWFC domain-containing protein n=2 Tax=Cacopsylla melanoneura TaxID=428564 RepID=A0A8D9B877_9HEMI
MIGRDAMQAASICCILVLTLPCLVHSAPTNLEETTALAEEDYKDYGYAAESTGCYYNYEHYEEGDRIVTNEPCLNCTCRNRMLMCYLRVCPFTRAIGQDCTVTKSPDQCCPVITCPEVPVQLITSSTTTELPASTTAVGYVDDYGCTMEDNKFYADGAKVPSNPDKPCELCYCIRNKTACVMLECTLQIEGCQPVYEEGVCCPVRYDCDQPAQLDDASSSTAGTTTGLVFTTTPAGSLDCYHGGAIYHDGESIPNSDRPCEHCYCVRGDIVCAVQDCGQPLKGKDCTPNPIPAGQCCPTTYECPNSTASTNKEPELDSTTIATITGFETNELTPPEGTQIDDQPNTENDNEGLPHISDDLGIEHDGIPIHHDEEETSPAEIEPEHDGHQDETHTDTPEPSANDIQETSSASFSTESATPIDQSTNAAIEDSSGNENEHAVEAEQNHTPSEDATTVNNEDNVEKDQAVTPHAVEEGPTTVNDASNMNTLNDRLANVNNNDASNTDTNDQAVESATTASTEVSSPSGNEETSPDNVHSDNVSSDESSSVSPSQNTDQAVESATTVSADDPIIGEQETSSVASEQSENVTPSADQGSLLVENESTATSNAEPTGTVSPTADDESPPTSISHETPESADKTETSETPASINQDESSTAAASISQDESSTAAAINSQDESSTAAASSNQDESSTAAASIN